MKTMRKSTWRSLLPATALYLAASATANASMAVGWWGGTWNCNIDGRPAMMKWVSVNVAEEECDDESCSQSTSVHWKGSFSDNGSRWVELSNAHMGNQGGLYFNHADGNKWYLPKPQGGRSDGWTTWQGKRYQLSCWR